AALHRRRQIELAQKVSDLGWNISRIVDARDATGGELDHPGKQIDALLRRALTARRDDAARTAGDPVGDLAAARRLGAGNTERAADRGEDGVARAHSNPSCMILCARQRCWKVAPAGAGKSRWRVQPPASGSQVKRPLRRPISPSRRIASPVAKP